MIKVRSKEEIYQMLNYVLEPEDIKDEELMTHWMDVLFQLHKIRQKFPRPTKSLIEVEKEVFATRKMIVDNDKLIIDSNHSIKWSQENKEDIKVLGDVTLESCEKNLTVIGNVNGNFIDIEGDLKADTICNFGNLTIYCNKLHTDDLRASGNITIHSKEIISSDFYADKATINGNITTTFYSSNSSEVNGILNARAVNKSSDENFKVDLNKP
jgi:hypothetical protein